MPTKNHFNCSKMPVIRQYSDISQVFSILVPFSLIRFTRFPFDSLHVIGRLWSRTTLVEQGISMVPNHLSWGSVLAWTLFAPASRLSVAQNSLAKIVNAPTELIIVCGGAEKKQERAKVSRILPNS